MASIEAFERTFEAMDMGQTLLVLGGTWPNVGETAELHVGLRYFVPIRSLIHGLEEHPMQENQLWTADSEDPVKVDFTRDKERLAHDHSDRDEAPLVGYGKKIGRIGSQVVDIWTLGGFSDTIFHIGKSE